MKPYAQGRDWTLYHGDCMEILPTLGQVDAVVTDPPYGIGLRCEGEASGGRGRQEFSAIQGDDRPFDPAPFLGFSDALMFGCNNYAQRLPDGGQWYCWDKVLRNGLSVRIAECEFAWHKNGTKPRVFRHLWSGAYRDSESGQRSSHPTQKPVALMKWCLAKVDGGTILDPFTGSGTTGVACLKTGRKFIGIEIDEGYCEVAARRLRHAEEDTALFAEHAGEVAHA